MKRPNVLALHSIDHFAMEVPDLEEARRFYDAFGLDVRNEAGGLGLYTRGDDHCWGRLFLGPARRLYYICFGIYSEDEAAFAAHLEKSNVRRIDPPKAATADGIWFEGFDGLPLNIRVAEKATPDSKSHFSATSGAPGASSAVFNSAAPKTHPRRFSHMAIFTSDVVAATAWYSAVLGLRLSDGSGPVVAFMHGAHGSDHHLLALVGSTHRGLHHTSWDVGSIQEVGLGSAQMLHAGYTKGWGVGRHVLGANYFYYATDPWGGHAEYSADIDYIPADCDWPSNPNHDPGDSFYLWGPNLPHGFIDNAEPSGA